MCLVDVSYTLNGQRWEKVGIEDDTCDRALYDAQIALTADGLSSDVLRALVTKMKVESGDKRGVRGVDPGDSWTVQHDGVTLTITAR